MMDKLTSSSKAKHTATELQNGNAAINRESADISMQNQSTEQFQENLPLVKPTVQPMIRFKLQSSYRTRYGVWLSIVLLFAASLAAVIWRGGAVEWLLLVVTSLLIVGSGLLPLIASTKISYNRTISTALSENGEMMLESSLHRFFRIPGIWYVVHEQYENLSQVNKEPLSYRTSFTPFFHRTMQLQYSLKHTERGKYESLPTEIIVGDWLGLTSIAVYKHLEQSFAVLPQLQSPSEESYVSHYAVNHWRGARSNNDANDVSLIEATDNSSSSLLKNDGQRTDYSSQLNHVLSEQTRPYIEGDSYRRLDVRAAARGRGLQTKLGEEAEYEPKHCIIIDQYALPYQDSIRNQLFEAMILWAVAEIHEQGKRQPLIIITDDWTFEYTSDAQSYELRCLLALAKADVELRMKDRLSHLSVLLPANGHITVFTGDWREQDSWSSLSELAWAKGSTLNIQFATSNRVMTYAMREQHKKLEQSGIKLIWRYSAPFGSELVNVIEGSERYATSPIRA